MLARSPELAEKWLRALFALQRAVVDVAVFPTWWRQTLHELARLVLDHEMPHLDRDWEAEDQTHRAHLDAILPIDQLKEVINTHPNSQVNVRKRAAAAREDATDI